MSQKALWILTRPELSSNKDLEKEFNTEIFRRVERKVDSTDPRIILFRPQGRPKEEFESLIAPLLREEKGLLDDTIIVSISKNKERSDAYLAETKFSFKLTVKLVLTESKLVIARNEDTFGKLTNILVSAYGFERKVACNTKVTPSMSASKRQLKNSSWVNQRSATDNTYGEELQVPEHVMPLKQTAGYTKYEEESLQLLASIRSEGIETRKALVEGLNKIADMLRYFIPKENPEKVKDNKQNDYENVNTKDPFRQAEQLEVSVEQRTSSKVLSATPSYHVEKNERENGTPGSGQRDPSRGQEVAGTARGETVRNQKEIDSGQIDTFRGQGVGGTERGETVRNQKEIDSGQIDTFRGQGVGGTERGETVRNQREIFNGQIDTLRGQGVGGTERGETVRNQKEIDSGQIDNFRGQGMGGTERGETVRNQKEIDSGQIDTFRGQGVGGTERGETVRIQKEIDSGQTDTFRGQGVGRTKRGETVRNQKEIDSGQIDNFRGQGVGGTERGETVRIQKEIDSGQIDTTRGQEEAGCELRKIGSGQTDTCRKQGKTGTVNRETDPVQKKTCIVQGETRKKRWWHFY